MKKITLLALAIMAFQFNFAQDTCATAISISTGTTSVGSIDGTADNTCGWQTAATAGEWYSYTPTANYTVTISSNLLANDGIINSDDTRVSIYTGSCGALQCLTGNDDFDFDNGIYLSELTFSATSGTTYYILWDNRWSASGFDFTLTEEACTATAAPQAVTTPTPADGATDVAIVGGNGVVFSWLESTVGETAESYSISIGITPTGDDIGFLAEVSSGNLITFGATSGTTYYWKIDAVNCVGETSSDVWSFTTAVCTEAAIPTSVASNPTPANGASGVAIQAPDGGVVFEWTAPDVEGESYNFNIGIANPPTQTIVDIESGDLITGFAVNTTYYWSIDVVNCFGQTTTTNVWSFTTDDVLSIEDNELQAPLSVYPNPTSGILNIKSNQDIDTINVFNLLGQNVASFSKNAIIDSSIDLSDLSNGLYLVKITSRDKTQTIRVTKE